MKQNKLYESAGVSLTRANQALTKIKKLTSSTNNKGVIGNIGGFAGMFDLNKYGYEEPILVSGTDGVGTKLLLAIDANRGHNHIGQDLVAMCANDIVTIGARPLFFLDYFACGKLNPDTMTEVVKGISNALKTFDCALIGGETAELPQMYHDGHYELAGFVVGAVDKKKMIDGAKQVKEKDVLIALPSSGIHANGFSLVRKILFQDHNFSYVEKVPYTTSTIISELLTPTKLYVNQILNLQKEVDVHGVSHITGGGFYENIPRMMNDKLTFDINFKDVKVLPIFKWLQELSNASDEDMFSTFNMGVGMVIAVSREDEEKTLSLLKKTGEKAYKIGYVKSKT